MINKAIILGVLLLWFGNAFSQDDEYVYKWYTSNLEYLDKEKERGCGDSDYLKKIYWIQSIINKVSFNETEGSTDRKLLVKSLRGTLLSINLNNCILIEEFTTFHALNCNVYVIDDSGSKYKMKKEKGEWILISKDEIENYDIFIQEFNKIEPKLSCDGVWLEKYHIVLTLVENEVFKSKILTAPCSTTEINITW